MNRMNRRPELVRVTNELAQRWSKGYINSEHDLMVSLERVLGKETCLRLAGEVVDSGEQNRLRSWVHARLQEARELGSDFALPDLQLLSGTFLKTTDLDVDLWYVCYLEDGSVTPPRTGAYWKVQDQEGRLGYLQAEDQELAT